MRNGQPHRDWALPEHTTFHLNHQCNVKNEIFNFLANSPWIQDHLHHKVCTWNINEIRHPQLISIYISGIILLKRHVSDMRKSDAFNLTGAPPSYTFVTRFYRRTLRPVVLISVLIWGDRHWNNLLTNCCSYCVSRHMGIVFVCHSILFLLHWHVWRTLEEWVCLQAELMGRLTKLCSDQFLQKCLSIQQKYVFCFLATLHLVWLSSGGASKLGLISIIIGAIYIGVLCIMV